MAGPATCEIVIDAAAEQVFAAVTDYPRYREYTPEVKKVVVLSRHASEAEVEYHLDLGLKKIIYVLHHIEERPMRVSWSLVRGDFLKSINGSWELSSEGKGTRLHYQVAVELEKIPFLPRSVVDNVAAQLTQVQLPKMLESVKRVVEKKS